jgi:phenylacetate-CoA ligase
MKSLLFPEDISSKNIEVAFNALFDDIFSKTSHEWTRVRNTRFLFMFREMSKKVPAYKKFLSLKKIDTQTIRSVSSVEALPSLNKDNYLRKNSWEDLCKKGSLVSSSIVMTATSGSTGDPFYFPRSSSFDVQTSLYYEMFLNSSSISKKKSTLVIDSFGMGVWIGGLITYQAFKLISERGHPLTIITPGINKQEIFKALKHLGKKFDQIILCGYPPFIKDVVDQAKSNGITLSHFDMRFIFAAEGFSETFREYIMKQSGIIDVYRGTMSIYGTADLGTMAYETPLSILLRRLALENKSLYLALFGQASRLPTLTQYLPYFINFESKKGSLYGTGGTVLPLVRYELGDNGGEFSFEKMTLLCKESGIDLDKEIKIAKIEDTITELPFVYVYERDDFSTKLYGAIIYPEHIKKGLLQEQFQEMVTGKFTMSTKFDEKEDAYLEVNIELQPYKKATLGFTKIITQAISDSLAKESSEYRNNLTLLSPSKVEPRVIFWDYEDGLYFKPAGKQKWVKKDI